VTGRGQGNRLSIRFGEETGGSTSALIWCASSPHEDPGRVREVEPESPRAALPTGPPGPTTGPSNKHMLRTTSEGRTP
jgi:hypothetical protein